MKSVTTAFSQFLRLAFFRSPNYVAGVSGWTINQDGSVEFNNGTFRGNIVGGALYIYTGAGALGNPPQLAIVPAGTTQDPYGNAIGTSKILIQANVITESGGIFRTAAAAPLLQLDGTHNAFLVYNAASGLAETIAPVGTSDGLGSTVLPGIAAYTTSAPFIAIQIDPSSAAILWQTASSQGGPWTANGPLVKDVSGALALISGTQGGAVQTSLTLTSGASVAATLIGTGGPFALPNEAAPSNALTTNASILFASSGHLKTVSTSTGGDGNTYSTEHGIQQVSPRSQSFSAVAAANIGGLSWPVVAGTYIVNACLTIEWNAAAGIPQMVFAGPAVSQYDVRFETRQSGSSSTANTNALAAAAAGNGTGYNGALVNITQAMTGAGVFFILDISAEFTFTASGTLTLQAASSIAGDAWLVFSGRWEVKPL